MKKRSKLCAGLFSLLISVILVSPCFGFKVGDFLKAVTPEKETKEKESGSSGFGLGKMGKLVGTVTELATDSKVGPVNEFFLGREVAARFLGAYKPIAQDQPTTDYLKKVGTSLSLFSRYPFPYRPYTYVILDSKEINAFAAPGGFIFITTGMLNFLENEDELAVILGHEIAHIELQHGLNAVGQEKVMKLFTLMKDLLVDSGTSQGDLKSQLFKSLFDKITKELMNIVRQGYNVEMETEADLRGIEISYAAGYDPRVFPEVLNRFKKQNNNYGGANYPKERMADAENKLKSMRDVNEAEVSGVRTKRFRNATKTISKR